MKHYTTNGEFLTTASETALKEYEFLIEKHKDCVIVVQEFEIDAQPFRTLKFWWGKIEPVNPLQQAINFMIMD